MKNTNFPTAYPQQSVAPTEDQLLTPAQAAAVLGVSRSTLAGFRKGSTPGGPKYIRFNAKVVRYRLADLLAFIAEREVA